MNISRMGKTENDFYSKQHPPFKYHLGNLVASSLSGFIAGIIVTLIIIFALCDVILKS